MKTGEVSKMMGVNPKTITNWTDQEDLMPFFSMLARRHEETEGQREYTEQDILVINTVRAHKNRSNSWRDVATLLGTGFRETDMPISATLAKTISPADQVAGMMAIKAERDTALAQLQDSMFEIERLRRENREQNEEIRELDRRIARLELRLELLQEQRSEKSKTDAKP